MAAVRGAEVIGAIVAAFVLWARANALPDLDPHRADAIVSAALAHQTARVPAQLVVGLAWAESRFQPFAQPACGVMQVYPHDLHLDDAISCRAWRADTQAAVDAGVVAGIAEIETMLDDSRVHGDLHLALLYRACGNRAFIPGACDMERWVSDALARARWLGMPSSPRGQI